MKKAIVLIMVIILGISINVYAGGFSDVKTQGNWAYESIMWGVEKGLVKGYGDGTFKPKAQITESELLSVLIGYTKVIPGEKEAGHWSNHLYKAVEQYNLPLKGHTNNKAKDTALTRGEIARIIAAKNGFNLDERQAIYYMYENGISYGIEDKNLSFESYDRNSAVQREQIPAFFQRLHNKGHTTFMGKKSQVNPEEMGGIKNIPKDNTVVTDKDFKDLSDKVYPPVKETGGSGTLEDPIVVGDNGGFLAFQELYSKNPGILNKMVGKVNGIVTPVNPGMTQSNMKSGLVLKTMYNTKVVRNGFHDKDLFFKITEDHWRGKYLDDNQMKHMYDLEKEYLGNTTYASSGYYLVKGKTHDVMFSATNSDLIVHIYVKGTDVGNVPVRK